MPSAPPETSTALPSIDTTPAEALAIVVSVACPSSTLPTPKAVEVDAVIPLTSNPLALVNVADVGVPKIAPLGIVTVPVNVGEAIGALEVSIGCT